MVGQAPGGATDIVGRLVASKMTDSLGQNVVLENRTGAAGSIAAATVAKSAPDGYTILVVSSSYSINPSLYATLPFDPQKDLTPISLLAEAPFLLVVHPSVPADSLKELVALSKQKDLNFAVSGTGGAPHLAGVALAQAVGARWEYVPYKGGSQAISDTVGGQTQVMMNGMLATYPHVQGGKLKLLAVSKRSRMPLIGEVPTIAEQGVPNFESGSWHGMLVPKGTPDAVVQKVNADLVAALKLPELRARFIELGAEPQGGTTAATTSFIKDEEARWRGVIKSANVTLE
jgi:tripartite-type tricarboxylate transporter receptor subunit TctC